MISSVRNNLISQLEKHTGIGVDYESISPSVFRYILIRNVNVYDSALNEKIGSAEQIIIKYNIFSLLTGDYDNLIDYIKIYDGYVSLDVNKNEQTLSKIKLLLENAKSDAAKKSAEEPEQKKNRFLFLPKLKPMEISVKNFSLGVKREKEDKKTETFFCVLNAGKFFVDEKKCGFELGSNIFYDVYENGSAPSFARTFSSVIESKGEFFKDLSGGSSIVGLSFSHSGVSLAEKASFFVSYSGNVFKLMSMQNLRPLDFQVSWNTATKEVYGKWKSDKLKPLKFLKFKKENMILTAFKDFSLTGDAEFYFRGSKDWNFNADFNADIPQFNIDGFSFDGAFFNTSLQGNNGKLNLKKFIIDGEGIQTAANASYDFNEGSLNGEFNLLKLILPTGESLSSAVKLSGNKKGYRINVPYIKSGSGKLNSVSLTAVPANERIYFYLNAQDDLGKYAFDASLLMPVGEQKPFLEIHSALDAVSVGNAVKMAEGLLPALQKVSAASSSLNGLQLTTEFYFSTDFKDFSYNFIQVVLASAVSDGFYSAFSVNGTGSSFELENINGSFAGMDVTGEIKAYLENNGLSFDSLFSVNAIAYNISGLYTDGNLSVYGDYGLAVNMLKDETGLLKGFAVVNDLPMPGLNTYFSFDSSFEAESMQRWNFVCNVLKLAKGGDALSEYNTFEFIMKGAGNQDAIVFREIILSGAEQPMQGYANVDFIREKDSSDFGIDVNLALSDEAEKETFNFKSVFSLRDKFYFDGSSSIKNISLARFMKKQKPENTLNADLSFLGSGGDFFAKLNLESVQATIKGKDLKAAGTLSADDSSLRVEGANVSWGTHKISDIEAALYPLKAEGNIILDYAGKLGEDEAASKLRLDYSGLSTSESPAKNIFAAIPSLFKNYNINILLSDLKFGDKRKAENISATLIKEPGIIAFSAGKNDEVYGLLLDDGTVSLHIDESLPLRCNIDGKISDESIDINCMGIYLDMPLLWNLTPLTATVKFNSGAVTGDIKILGTKSEPEFFSNLKCVSVEATSPYYAPEVYGPVDISVKLEGTSLLVPYTVVPGKSTNLWASVTSEFSGWIPSETIVQCGSLDGKMGLMKTKNLAFHSDGYASCDLTIAITPEEVNLTGYAVFDKGYFSIPFQDLHKIEERYSGKGPEFKMNLALYLGKKAEFRWPSTEIPIMRALVPTGEEPIVLTVNTGSPGFNMKGNSFIRGGEIFYIKRNFYIREGDVRFVPGHEGFEPLVSMRAEIRDKDEGGEPIKIILTAKDQSLENFNPKLTTEPPRSESEIMQLLGQVFIGDISKDNFLQTALITATDIVTQIGVFKKTESKIRDLLHVDAFSMRTLLIQNAIFGNLFRTSTDTPLTIGNYFDNTSVYAGKYFGSEIYADVLLHLSYYDPLLIRNAGIRKPVYGNLLFMPELGLEMATPFFMIRSAIAPSRPDTLFVSDSKFTLSWKFSY